MRMLVLLLLFLSSCGRHDSQDVDSNDLSLLTDIVNVYKLQANQVETVEGWIQPEDCDSALFNGLASMALPNINLKAAQVAAGQWHRRPAVLGNCYPNESKSEISRDMMVGIIWSIWRRRDLQAADDLLQYGRSNLWRMGEGQVQDTQEVPNFMRLLAEVIYQLGGSNYAERSLAPSLEVAGGTDYQRHLQVMFIALKGEVYGSLSEHDVSVLKHHVDEQAWNPLFYSVYHKYKDGDLSQLSSLLSPTLWPRNRLPTSADRCSSWPTQRESSSADLQPCDENKVHSGAELMVILSILRGA